MPIYEFYCSPCNKLLNFFSRTVNTTTLPSCPYCGEALSKQVSHFSAPRGGDSSDELGDAPFDDSRMQEAVDQFGDTLDTLGDSDDPQQSAAMMRQFSEASGLGFNRDLQDALKRLERGEDPEAVSADMDALMESGVDPFAPGDRGLAGTKRVAPEKDPTLHEM